MQAHSLRIHELKTTKHQLSSKPEAERSLGTESQKKKGFVKWNFGQPVPVSG